MTVETDRLIGYFIRRIRDMDDVQLAVTERAMRMGLDDARGAEGRSSYSDRIAAVSDEWERRRGTPPALQHSECPGCGGSVTLSPISGGYAEKCVRCHATLYFHKPERSASAEVTNAKN